MRISNFWSSFPLGTRIVLQVMFLAALTASCGQKTPAPETVTFHIGDKASLPPLTYTVIEANWANELGQAPRQRFPEQRFLVLRVLVTNNGRSEVSVPLLSIETDQGKAYQETSNGESIPDWLGLIRNLAPAETINGHIVFDAPFGPYKMKVTNSNALQEKSAYIEIPTLLDQQTPTSQ